jgi:hypothetical protein
MPFDRWILVDTGKVTDEYQMPNDRWILSDKLILTNIRCLMTDEY